MTDEGDTVIFEAEFDAPPKKVWRALTIPEYLERWLDLPQTTEISLVEVDEPHSVTYRWRDAGTAGAAESIVRFEILPREDGGSSFKLIHAPATIPGAANSNEPMMRAA